MITARAFGIFNFANQYKVTIELVLFVHNIDRNIMILFDSGNAVLRETFTPPPPKNGPEMLSKSQIKISGM
jgi:hypothetical protein